LAQVQLLWPQNRQQTPTSWARGMASTNQLSDGFPACYTDMLCCRDFCPKSLRFWLPRLGCALGWFALCLYINCVSNAEVQRMVAGFYEAEWGYSQADYQAAQGWLRQHDESLYKTIWKDTLPNETHAKSSEAMQETYQNQTVKLYDLTFLYAGYYGLPPVHSTRYADIWVIISIAVGLTRFVILPGPRSMRWTFLIRVAIVLGMLYLWRSVTIFLTPLPNPDHTCVPKISHPDNVWLEGLATLKGGELTCQDVMFSGHTLMGTTFTLFTARYSQKAPWFKWAQHPGPKYALHMAVGFWQFGGWYAIAASRFHYSLDVFVGVVLTYLSYHWYHSKVLSLQTKHKAGLGRCFTAIIEWLECEARDVLERETRAVRNGADQVGMFQPLLGVEEA